MLKSKRPSSYPMALSEKHWIELQSMIDSALARIPRMVQHYRDPNVRKNLMLQNVNDFVLGYILASVSVAIEVLIGVPRFRPVRWTQN